MAQLAAQQRSAAAGPRPHCTARPPRPLHPPPPNNVSGAHFPSTHPPTLHCLVSSVASFALCCPALEQQQRLGCNSDNLPLLASLAILTAGLSLQECRPTTHLLISIIQAH